MTDNPLLPFPETDTLRDSEPSTKTVPLCVEVAVPLPIPGLFSYLIPAELQDKVKKGVRVRIPFKNREVVGYAVGKKESPSGIRLKPLIAVLDEEPVLSEKMLQLTEWISRYYGSGWGEAIEHALPKWVKYGKKATRALSSPNALVGDPRLKSCGGDNEKKGELKLSPDQTKAMSSILKALDHPPAKPILLHGVTGSGKSEIYIRSIREVLKRNQSAVCLVPEIALTEQIRRFFYQHFRDQLEILHSKLTDNERFLAWKRLEKGLKRIVLGPRSAVFAPVVNLGLILMDEEHEGSYKQETTPRYHAREVAAWRAQNENALFVMGTATPSLETMYRSEKGEVERVELSTRIDDKALPKVEILDLKTWMDNRKKAMILSPRLISEIETNLKKKEGTLLLLNRRGYSTHIHCLRCGSVEACKSCQVSLTFHQEEERLLCHYCNYEKPISEVCANCRAPVLRFAGFGTEKVESEVAKLFPTARIARMDADSVRKRGSHEEILKDFRAETTDILIGTQMIAKGFDFPHVTLVGVVLADVGLSLPDFRSAERTFQLLTQVAGRAGRGNRPGRVLIQTFSPHHPSIHLSKDHDYWNFYRQEIPIRLEYRYPPSYRLTNLIIRSRDEKKAYLFARTVKESLAVEIRQTEIVGPAPLPFYKLRGHYRWHVMIKSPRQTEAVSPVILSVLQGLKKPAGVAFALDVDPLNIL